MAQDLHWLAEIAPIVRLLVAGFAEDGAVVQCVAAAVGYSADVVRGGFFAVPIPKFAQAVAAHSAAIALAVIGLVNDGMGEMWTCHDLVYFVGLQVTVFPVFGDVKLKGSYQFPYQVLRHAPQPRPRFFVRRHIDDHACGEYGEEEDAEFFAGWGWVGHGWLGLSGIA